MLVTYPLTAFAALSSMELTFAPFRVGGILGRA